MTLHDNRSMPSASIIVELAYPDVRAAAQWLCHAFGFVERLRIGGHRVQLAYGNGAIVVVAASAAPAPQATHRVMVRVADADAHHAQAVRADARIVSTPTDYPYGERQYGAIDPGGHAWTFSQSIADVDPASWGGELVG